MTPWLTLVVFRNNVCEVSERLPEHALVHEVSVVVHMCANTVQVHKPAVCCGERARDASVVAEREKRVLLVQRGRGANSRFKPWVETEVREVDLKIAEYKDEVLAPYSFHATIRRSFRSLSTLRVTSDTTTSPRSMSPQARWRAARGSPRRSWCPREKAPANIASMLRPLPRAPRSRVP
jgi:hypothetical protein